MGEEPSVGSIGVVYYTVSHTNDGVEFNIHAFVHLAESPKDCA